MSNLSQFYPQGSGASGFIDVETLILSGGGGGGGGSNYGGAGGGGAVFYGFLSIKPGSTCTALVGAGGNGGPAPSAQAGSLGGQSSVTTPTGTYRVIGGGGGGGSAFGGGGTTGGTGGGDAYGVLIPGTRGRKNPGAYGIGGVEPYYHKTSVEEIGPNNAYYSTFSSAESGISVRNGTYMGFSGGGTAAFPFSPGSGPTAANVQYITASGGAGGQATRVIDAPAVIYGIAGSGYQSDITGSRVEYGAGNDSFTGITQGGANSGRGGGGNVAPSTGSGYSGGSGVVVMRYPTQFAAASYSPTPAVTDLSPATPGYRTYRFTASATITFPQ